MGVANVFEKLYPTTRSAKRGLTVTLTWNVVWLALGGLVLAAAAWASGMKMGYVYAKKDAAYVLRAPNPNPLVALPTWRAWADADVAYEPPEDLALLFNLTGREIPGTGGMTTGDVWNGTQSKMRDRFFSRSNADE